ncbi:MAG: ribonuclease Z [Oscillospiraceae bacterium]|nr:ribonuclease Z [Oscillospiraceae bacterium]
MLEIFLPGTGGMKPLPDRFLTGLWAEHDGSGLLIDCGEGMQVALAKISRSLARLDVLLITHFHADHISGLPGLLLSTGNFGKTSPLKIYCPVGGTEIIKKLCCICPELPFEVKVKEISGRGEIMWEDISVGYMPIRHRVPGLCYSLTEKRKPVFSPEKAKALGIPVNFWKELHGGKSVNIDGREITTEMVTDGERQPLKVTYITDSVYFDELAEFAFRSNLLICEGMYGSEEYREKMKEKQHMIFSDSARVASLSESEELWLTHYSPAMTDPREYEKQIKAMFANTIISRDGISKIIK